MRRRVETLLTGLMIRTLLKVGVAGAVLALICWAGKNFLLADWAVQSFVMKGVWLLGTIVVAGAGFFVAAMALRIDEINAITAIVKRKLGRKNATSA